jgi:hypothetical protein
MNHRGGERKEKEKKKLSRFKKQYAGKKKN